MDAKEVTLPSRALFPLVLSKHNTFGSIFHFEDRSPRQRDTRFLAEGSCAFVDFLHGRPSIELACPYSSPLFV